MITFDKQINYEDVYKDLAGGGIPLKFYRRLPSQRGYGLFSLIRRFAFPILKHLGRQALPIGQDILSDILPGVKQAKERLKQKAVSAIHSVGDQIQKGVGKRRRKKLGMKKKRSGKTRNTTKNKSRVLVGGKKRKRTTKKTTKRKSRKRNSKSFDIFK